MTGTKGVLSILIAVSMATVGCRDSGKPEGKPAKGAAKDMTLDLANGATMKLVLIPAGKFMMGSPETEKDRDEDEGPQHEVTISKPFYIGITEVTQGQWAAVMGTTPWKGKSRVTEDPRNAANYISWNDADAFCRKLSGKADKSVRLPTEAEWEYACRAGSNTRFYYGDDDEYSDLNQYAWYARNVWGAQAHPVGAKKPNAWGLFDMHGNVWEWCSDWHAESYVDAKKIDPKGPDSGTERVMRGGNWSLGLWSCRSAFRHRGTPDDRSITTGIRVVAEVGGGD